MKVIEIPAGTKGFDLNQPLTPETARWFMNKGFRFVCRYVPRVTMAAYDVSRAERDIILTAGLGLMLVQHVEKEGWTPSPEKGTAYGLAAAAHAQRVGYPLGGMVWLDLEGLHALKDQVDVPAALTIKYCNNWYAAVAKAGFTPGVYIGWHCGLTAHDQYYRLRFEHYWFAYNLDGRFHTAIRGAQMLQGEAHEGLVPSGWAPNEIDTNVVQRDHLGGLPLVCAPEEWDVPL
jgi:hypothetical protein